MVATVDDEDFERLAQWRWHATSDFYAARTVYSVSSEGKRKWKTVLMSHEVLAPKPGFEIDHKNGVKTDNRRENLRYATEAQNRQNVGHRRSNKTGFKGVSWNKGAKKFVATIGVGGKVKHLGCFDRASDAALAYNAAAVKLHGEFARLN